MGGHSSHAMVLSSNREHGTPWWVQSLATGPFSKDTEPICQTSYRRMIRETRQTETGSTEPEGSNHVALRATGEWEGHCPTLGQQRKRRAYWQLEVVSNLAPQRGAAAAQGWLGRSPKTHSLERWTGAEPPSLLLEEAREL